MLLADFYLRNRRTEEAVSSGAVKGEKIGAFGLTEPNAGTDAAMQQTIAEDCGDHYRLNGSKIFISGGGIADVYVIMAMTDQSKGTKGEN